MHSITTIIKKLSLSIAVLLLSGATTLGMVGVAAADCDPTPPAEASYGNGIHRPTGSAAVTYTYDCSTDTWTNAHYTYYPKTNTYVAEYPANYKYNCDTGVWTMDEWDYSPGDGAYHLNRTATDSPGLDTNCPVAPVAAQNGGGSGGAGSSGSSGSTGITNTGPGSNNTTNGNVTLNGSATNNTGMGLNNILVSNANTGNAFVISNTSGGSATSGTAQSVADIANLLQSTSNAFGNNAAVFTADINGDVTGDFMFDPAAIMNTGPGSNNQAANNLTVNTNNTNNLNAQINNNIDVGATSGDATVANNTKGGDATSGNAQAIVNLMNLINSTVASGQSFIGTININGNLNGDILLPQGLIDQLLASTGPGSNNVASTNVTDNSKTNNNTTQNISNTIQSSATTGNANVSGNTNSGSATSGNAKTGVTLLNLTGSDTVGKNNILVFVNVLGQWVGMIMNAPAGSTAASLGGGISSTGPNSNNTASTNVTDNSTTTNNATMGINNNVNVHAKSGNASVTGNTTGGNAKSGDASTAVNILNIEGSNINLSDWFGVLFINVFGMWNGSFGVNTAAGNPVTNPSNNAVQAANQTAMLDQFRQFATFAAHGSSTTSSGSTSGSTGEVLASSVTAPVAQKLATTQSGTAKSVAPQHTSFLMPAIGVGLAVLILIFSERARFFGKKH